MDAPITEFQSTDSNVFGLLAIAEMAAEVWRLKGEIKQLESHREALKKILREHINRTQEPIDGEGFPTLRLVPVSQPWYDTTGLSPEQWHELIDFNDSLIRSDGDPFIRIHDGAYKKAREQGLPVELKAIRGQRTSQLRFDEEDKPSGGGFARMRRVGVDK